MRVKNADGMAGCVDPDLNLHCLLRPDLMVIKNYATEQEILNAHTYNI